MSIQSIRFNGINRSANAHQTNLGDCQELINIRSENGSLKLEKDHKVISADIPYKRILLHDTAGRRNYLGYDNSGIVWFDPTTGNVIKRLYSSYKKLDDIHISTINNMIVISDKNDVSNTIYLFTENTYKLFVDQNGLELPITITHNVNTVTAAGEVSENDLKSAPFKLDFSSSFTGTEQDRLNTITGARNKFFSENKRWVMGYYLVGINFTLWDGTETKLTRLTPFYPEQAQYNDATPITLPLLTYNNSTSEYVLNFAGIIKTHSYSIGTSANISEYKEYIKAINVYVSDPIDIMVFESDYVDFSKFPLENATYTPLGLIKAELDKQLMYKSASYTLDDVASGKAAAQIEFGVDFLPTNKTLDVDNGLVTRAGHMQSYNNRLHYYNSKCRLNLTNGFHITSLNSNESAFQADILIYLRGPEGDVILRYNDITLHGTKLDMMVIVQDSRVYKVVFLRGNSYAEILLNSSSRYNYAYGYFKELNFKAGSDYQNITDTSGIYNEISAINVTAQNNPLVFPVEHSYSIQGTINTLALATEPISQTQIGQYPLYIFTDKGIYALEQGSNGVLYSNLTLINTDVCNRDVCQTRNGVAYIANGNVYILAGRNNLNLSLMLKGQIDTDIRQSSSYQLACMNKALYDMTNYLSQVPLEEFLKNAMLSYVASTDDLIVGNPDYPYSYVFSFLYKSWHKTTETFTRVGDNILLRYLLVNHTTDLRATGRIYVTNAVIQPSHQFNALFQASSYNISHITGFSEKYALIIDGVQVSAALFRYPTQLSVVIALLCKDIPYLDEYFDGNQYKVYCSMALKSGALLEVINLNTQYTVMSATFEDIADTVVTIPNKGIGDKITITASNVSRTTRSIQNADTVISLAEEITDTINSSYSYGISAMMSNNLIDLAALTAGESGNNISVRCSAGNYVGVYIEPMHGGKNLTLSPGDYTQLIDYSESEDTVKAFHVQSCPISWPNAYTTINRMILSCKANINPDCNLSLYLFASNNLKEWKCVAASQKSNVVLDHIRLQRSAKAYKYYIIIIGGRVHTITEISSISLDISPQLENKLR